MFSNESFNDSTIWIVVILVLLFGWGGNGFGSGNQNALSADMQRGFDTQNVMSRFDSLNQNLTNATYENAQQFANTNMAMMNGFNGVTSSINDLSHQLSECCCSLKTQMLQDKYDAVQNQLNLAEIASANAVQTQNILSSIGRYYTNPPVNPYYAYGYSGTTIQ